MSRGGWQIKHLRNIIRLKRFLNSKWFVGCITVSVFLYVFNKEERTAEENFETLRVLAFSVVFMDSFGLMFKLMNLFFSGNRKTQEINQSLKSQQSRIVYALGFVALVILIVMTDFSTLTFWAITFGLATGVGYSLFLLVGKILTRVWNSTKERARKRHFDEFTKRK